MESFELTVDLKIVFKGTSLQKICGPDSKHCWEKVDFIMNTKEFEAIDRLNFTLDIKKCNCLPTCTTISYSTEISQTSINWKEYVEGVTRGKNKRYKKYYF